VRAAPLSLRFGNTKIWFWLPRLKRRRYHDIIELNGHKIYPYYGHGGPRMWPTYGVCIKCGQSWLGGADTMFTAQSCGEEQ
jgi:hypothetical protein